MALRGVDAFGEPVKAAAEGTSATSESLPSWPVIRESEPRRIRVTVEFPSEEKGTPGAVVEGTYTTSDDGLIRVRDAEGKLLGTQRLKPCDDVEAAARKLLREKCGYNSFHAPLPFRSRLV